MKNERVVFIDWLRVIACFMVIVVHCCEPFYLGGNGTYISNRSDALWVTLIDSAMRAAVPLFVMASVYLLFPLKYDLSTFFKKRAVRVLVPFLIWSILYALIPLWGGAEGFDAKANLFSLLFNFTASAGHLWFVYMLLGLYLVMPLLSPWAEKVSKRALQLYIAIWLFTTLIPFFRHILPAGTLFAPSIGRELWGEANWNEFGLFYGVSGFVGYLFSGLYFKKFLPELSWKKTLAWALPMILVGYAVTALLFWQQIPETFPVNDSINLAVRMEISWRFCSFGVVLTVWGYFLLIRKIKAEGKLYQRMVLPLSQASYGTYLLHIFVLLFFYNLYVGRLSTPLCILSTAISTYCASSILSVLLRKIPTVGKYIAG